MATLEASTITHMTRRTARALVRQAINEMDGGQWECGHLRCRSKGDLYFVTAPAESIFNDPFSVTMELDYEFCLTEEDQPDVSDIIGDFELEIATKMND